ncbi:MAG: PepSY domain-containing protein [Candidatus Methylomirabilis sp.]|nr:PepSY domain-containing protein [Candidatus Methylomirabilis sp.]
MSFITLNRKVHTWVGVVLAVFVTVIGVTGLVLVHKKDLASILRTTEVSGALIPSWYAREMAEKAREIKAVAVGTKELTESALLTGTKAGLMMQQESRWARAGGDLDGVEVTALLATDERWLAGTRWGLFQSLDRGRTWAPIKDGPLGGGKKLEVRTLQLSLLHPRSVWMGTQNGLYRSRDGGAHWEDVSAVLPIDEKSRHVVAIAFAPGHQETVLVGTHNGLYRYNQTSGEVSELGGKQLALLATAAIPRMALDKYLTDLHTGKLFADRLWLLYDITAIGFVLFVGTGLYLWIYPTLARRRRLRLQRGNGGRGCAAIALFLAVLHGGRRWLSQPSSTRSSRDRASACRRWLSMRRQSRKEGVWSIRCHRPKPPVRSSRSGTTGGPATCFKGCPVSILRVHRESETTSACVGSTKNSRVFRWTGFSCPVAARNANFRSTGSPRSCSIAFASFGIRQRNSRATDLPDASISTPVRSRWSRRWRGVWVQAAEAIWTGRS